MESAHDLEHGLPGSEDPPQTREVQGVDAVHEEVGLDDVVEEDGFGDEEVDEDAGSGDDDDYGGEDLFDQYVDAFVDAMVEAQEQALNGIDISKFQSNLETVVSLLRKPYVAPPSVEDPDVVEVAGTSEDDTSDEAALAALAFAVSPFDGCNPLSLDPPLELTERDASLPQFLDIVNAINTHIVPAVPALLSLIHPDSTTSYPDSNVHPDFRTNIIQLICGLFYVPLQSTLPRNGVAEESPDIKDMIPILHHLPALLAHLRNGNVVDRSAILNMMEGLMDAVDKSRESDIDHDGIDQHHGAGGEEEYAVDGHVVRDEVKDLMVETLREVLFWEVQSDANQHRPESDTQESFAPSERRSILESFEYAVLLSRTACIDIFLAAGAYDWTVTQSIVQGSTAPTPPYYAQLPASAAVPKVLLAAQSCLAVIHTSIKDDDGLDNKFANHSTLFDDDIRSAFGQMRNFVLFNIVQVAEVCQFPLKRSTTPAGTPVVGDADADADAFDTWEAVIKSCAEFLNGVFSENPKLRFFLASQDDAVRALIMSLGRKDPTMYGTDAEWLFARFCAYDDDETPSVDGDITELSTDDVDAEGEDDEETKARRQLGHTSRAAFRDTLCTLLGEKGDKPWKGGLEFDDQLALLRGLQMSFPSIHSQAIRAGLPTFAINVLSNAAVDDKLAMLNILDKMMENEQTIGFYLLQAGIAVTLVSLLEIPTLVPPVVSVLSRLLDSYSPEPKSQSQRPALGKELTFPKVLSILTLFVCIDAAAASDEQIVAARSILRLLGDLVSKEAGTESWSYESDGDEPPPPCPLKDLIITPEFVRTAITLLSYEPQTIHLPGLDSEKEEPSPAAKDALHFLSHACWGYQRGYDLVVAAFKERFLPAPGSVNQDEIWMFSNLDDDSSFGRENLHMHLRVAAAVVAADGLPRAYEHLAREVKMLMPGVVEGSARDWKRRRAAVQALRVLLRGDGADIDAARNNAHLPLLLTNLFLHATKLSMESAYRILWLLSVEKDFNNDDDNGSKRLSPEQKEQIHIDRQRWILDERWSCLGAEEVVQALLKVLQHKPYDADKNVPDAASMDEVTLEKATKLHNNLVYEAKAIRLETVKRMVSLINVILPLLGAHAVILAGPLLVFSNGIDDKRAILSIVHRILCTKGLSFAPVVTNLKNLTSSPNPPSCAQYKEWVEAGPRLCDVVRQSGAVEHLLKVLATPTDEESDGFVDRIGAISALGALVERTLDPSEKVDVQRQFATDPHAVQNALKIFYGDDEWDALSAVISYGKLCNGLPNGVGLLDDAGKALPRVIKLFDTLDCYHDAIAPLLGQLASAGPEQITNLLKSYFVALSPRPDDAQSVKGKKNKKKKKHTPKVSQRDLWERLALLADTTDVARKAVVDAGAIDEARTLLDAETKDLWVHPLPTLAKLVLASEGYEAEIAHMLPRLKEIIPTDEAPCSEILALLDAFVIADISYLASQDLVPLLLEASCDYPLAFTPHIALSKTIHDIASDPTMYPLLLKELRERISNNSVIEKEKDSTWRTGYAAALKRIGDQGEIGRKLLVDAGAVEYAMKLLSYHHVQVNENGAKLSAFLAHSKDTLLFAQLAELGVTGLVETCRLKATNLSARSYSDNTDEDTDEDTFKYICRSYAEQAATMSKILDFFSGENGVYKEDEFGDLQ